MSVILLWHLEDLAYMQDGKKQLLRGLAVFLLGNDYSLGWNARKTYFCFLFNGFPREYFLLRESVA